MLDKLLSAVLIIGIFAFVIWAAKEDANHENICNHKVQFLNAAQLKQCMKEAP